MSDIQSAGTLAESGPSAVTAGLVMHADDVHLYGVNEDQLDAVFSPFSSISLNFATMMFGVVIALILVFLTVGLGNLQPTEQAILAALTFAGAVLFIAFSVAAGKDIQVRAESKKRIKKQRVLRLTD